MVLHCQKRGLSFSVQNQGKRTVLNINKGFYQFQSKLDAVADLSLSVSLSRFWLSKTKIII